MPLPKACQTTLNGPPEGSVTLTFPFCSRSSKSGRFGVSSCRGVWRLALRCRGGGSTSPAGERNLPHRTDARGLSGRSERCRFDRFMTSSVISCAPRSAQATEAAAAPNKARRDVSALDVVRRADPAAAGRPLEPLHRFSTRSPGPRLGSYRPAPNQCFARLPSNAPTRAALLSADSATNAN